MSVVNLPPPRIRPAMEQLLVLSAVGSDRTGIVRDLTRIVLDCGGNIVESRMNALASEFSVVMLIAGKWHTITRLETELEALAEGGLISVQLRRSEARGRRDNLLPYAADVVGLDQPGIVHGLAGFFSGRQIDIAELNTRSYAAAHTGAPMFSVQMTVNIPSDLHIAGLRDEFMDYCDQLNLDAIMEPVKS
jgi:glycine cleavage system transcriptional repressor